MQDKPGTYRTYEGVLVTPSLEKALGARSEAVKAYNQRIDFIQETQKTKNISKKQKDRLESEIAPFREQISKSDATISELVNSIKESQKAASAGGVLGQTLGSELLRTSSRERSVLTSL